ncbi:MAG: hypothetical protein WBA22_00855 [Candidatus Methanofastidiosia archaeon]
MTKGLSPDSLLLNQAKKVLLVKHELYIMTDDQWKEYQDLKDRERRLLESIR